VDPNIPQSGAATRSTAAELWGALAPDKRAEIRPGDITGAQTLEWWPPLRETWCEASVTLAMLHRPAGGDAWLQKYFDAGVRQICAPPAKSVDQASWCAYIWLCHLAALRDAIVVPPRAERWFDGQNVLGCDTWRREPVARFADIAEVWSGQASATCLAALGSLDTYWDVLDQLAERLKPPPTAEELRAAAEERRHQETLAAQARIAEEQRQRAAAEEAWRAEQRTEQQRQRQAAAKERRQRQQREDHLLAALRHKKRSRTNPSKPRGRRPDETRAKKIRRAIREVFADQHRAASAAGWWRHSNKGSWEPKLALLCNKLDEFQVSHSSQWESWSHQLHRPDGRDLVLRAIRYTLARGK
jgi:hypothetical protein